MIILRSRSLIIPNDEYNLGNDYDTNTATRVFQLDRVMEGIDLANLMFKLDLTYADGTSDTLALDSEVTDDKINLTWTVTKNQLHVPGTVVVQIRALNVDGNMKWTSYIGAFFVEASMFGSADYSGKLSEVEQFEVAIKSEKERVQNEKARQDAEAERVQAEAERKSAEEERKTAEAERKSAETVRSNAETARESAETEREKWYNSAKTNFDAAIASGDKAERIANSLETNVETNMKAAAASATAAAGSASAAAGSANEAKQYSQNWSALDQRVTKNANDIVTTNNNLSDGLYGTTQDTTLDQLMKHMSDWNHPFVFDIGYTLPIAPDSNNAIGIGERGMLHAFSYSGKHFYCIDASKGWQESPYALKSDLVPIQKGSAFLENIGSLSSPSQLKHAGFYKLPTMTADVNADAGTETMTEYATGDFYGLLLGTDINTTDGCVYGTLIVSSPRIRSAIWVGSIWQKKFISWYKVGKS